MSETEEPQTAHIRKAGLLEKYHVMRHHLGLDTCVITSARYVLSGDTFLDRHILFTALSHVIRKERALSIQIQDDGVREPVFIRLNTVDLSRIIEYRDDDSSALDPIMALLWLRRFEIGSADPLWRLAVLIDNTVVFAYHHAIGDGQSGLAFHRSLLSALNHWVELPPVTSDVISIPPSIALQPPVEEGVKTSVSLSKWFRTIYSIFAPLKWTSGYYAWTGNNVSTARVLRNNIRVWELPPEEAKALLDVCREHNSTLTSFFHTLSVLVVSYLLATKHPSTYKCKTVAMVVPISLRRFTNAPVDVMCNHVSSFQTYPKTIKFQSVTTGKQPWTDSFSWETSAKYAAQLRKSVKSSPEVVGLLKFLYGRYKEFFEGKLGKKRECGIEISNVGVFPSEQTGTSGSSASETGWKIEDVFFGQNDAIAGAAIKINVVGSPSGAVGVTFTWGDDAVDGAFAEGFVEEFKEAVGVILHKGKVTNGL